MKFTGNAHYFDFYSLQHQAETALHWVLFPLVCLIVYKLIRAMVSR